MDEITIGSETFISSKRAAKITGYAKDYIGQLCREGRVNARLVGRNWYVLESSIREHRFGSAPEPIPEAPKQEPVSVTAAWEAPRYAAETPEFVPELAPSAQKRASVELNQSDKVISDMQSAWQEWFTAKQPLVSEPVEELLLESGTDEFNISPSEKVETPEIPEEAPTAPEPVRLSRIPEEEAIPEVAPEALQEADGAEEVVTLHRSHAIRTEGEVIPTSHPVIDLGTEEVRARMNEKKEVPTLGETRKSNLPLKALLISLTGLVIAATIIGTGVADHLIEKTRFENGPQGKVLQFLGGTSSVINN